MQLFDDLFELALRGARIIREFTIATTEVLPVTCVKQEELEIINTNILRRKATVDCRRAALAAPIKTAARELFDDQCSLKS